MVAPTVTFRVLTLCWKLFTLSYTYPKQLMMKSKQVGTKPIHRLTASINGKNSDFVMAHPNAADKRPQEASSCVLALRFKSNGIFSPSSDSILLLCIPFSVERKILYCCSVCIRENDGQVREHHSVTMLLVTGKITLDIFFSW